MYACAWCYPRFATAVILSCTVDMVNRCDCIILFVPSFLRSFGKVSCSVFHPTLGSYIYYIQNIHIGKTLLCPENICETIWFLSHHTALAIATPTSNYCEQWCITKVISIFLFIIQRPLCDFSLDCVGYICHEAHSNFRWQTFVWKRIVSVTIWEIHCSVVGWTFNSCISWTLVRSFPNIKFLFFRFWLWPRNWWPISIHVWNKREIERAGEQRRSST